MGTEPLINVGPGGAIEAGLAAARHPESVPFWHDGENVAFRNLGIEKAIGAEDLLLTGKRVIRVAQAFANGARRAYFQLEDFAIFGWNQGSPPFFIGNTSDFADLIPYGDHLFIASNGLFRWSGSGGMAAVGDAGTVNLGLLFKEHLLLAGENRLIWPDIRNPEDFRRKKDKTGNILRFRNLGSHILAIRPLGSGIGVYTKDAMRHVGWKGGAFIFGENQEPVNGIGAVNSNSVCEAGFKNYGMTRNGIFVTDGSSFQYIDTPAFHGWLEANVNWDFPNRIFSFHNESFQEVVFSFLAMDGEQKGLAYKYTNGAFTKYKLDIHAAAPRDVFDYPLFGTQHGLAYGRGTTHSTAFVQSKPLDAGNSLRFKYFDNVRIVGEFVNSPQMKLGLHNDLNSAPTWVYEGDMQSSTFMPSDYREAVFLTIQFLCDEEASFSVSQILVTGKLAGDIFQ